MNIVVAGGAGYIGSHCCKMLALQGHTPIVVDNLTTGYRSLARWGIFEQGDIGDPEFVRALLGRYSVDAVMHFAANALVGESTVDPGKYYRNNVCATLALLTTMREQGVNRFIFSSTAAIFGEPEAIPIGEDHRKAPINPYGRSKLMVEQILEDFSLSYDLKYVSFRYFNAAGADPDGEIGEMHDPETHLVPLVFRAAREHGKQLDIYGTDYPTKDGTCVRDYVHVVDLSAAHILAVQWLKDGGSSQVFNLGNQKGFSVREVVDCASRISGLRVPSRETDRRPGDPAVLVADSSKARSVLGWKPKYESLDDILSTAWQWHRKQ